MTFLHAAAILGGLAAWIVLWTAALVAIADHVSHGGTR